MRTVVVLVALGVLAPMTVHADSFSFKISIGDQDHGYCCNDEPEFVRYVYRWHRLPCGRRVKQVRVVYRDCHNEFIDGPWEIEFGGHWCNSCEVRYGCNSGCSHGGCYRHGKRVYVNKTWSPHRAPVRHVREVEYHSHPRRTRYRSSAPVIEKKIVKTVVTTPGRSHAPGLRKSSRDVHYRNDHSGSVKYKSRERTKSHVRQSHSGRSVELADMGTKVQSYSKKKVVVKR